MKAPAFKLERAAARRALGRIDTDWFIGVEDGVDLEADLGREGEEAGRLGDVVSSVAMRRPRYLTLA